MEIEICCNSIASARAAKAGGADRIELCDRLEVGGITPAETSILVCVKELGLRTHVLVRPREGDFCYTDSEYEQIKEQVDMCRRCGVRAVVVGFLTREGCIDEKRTKEIVDWARPMEVTFHRAFDEIKESPEVALEKVVRAGCHRILTSGCAASAEEGMGVIKRLVELAGGRIAILAGAGISPQNALKIADGTGVTELHGSCKTRLADGSMVTDPEVVKQLVAKFK